MSGQRRNMNLIIAVVALVLVALIVGFLAPSPRPNDAPDARPQPTEPESATVSSTPSPPQPAPDDQGDDEGARRTPLNLVGATVVRDSNAGAGVFEGRVVSWSTGAGVGGAELTFAHGGTVSSTRSDDDGLFRFAVSAPGRYELAEVTAEGYLPFAPEWGHSPIRLVAHEGVLIRGITITLRPTIDYTGVVVDPEERPVEGALVTILSTPGGMTDLDPQEDRFETDLEGRFTFNAPDHALLEARHPEYSPGRATLDSAAQVSHRLTIHLGPPGQSPERMQITGRVVNISGDPVEDALVTSRYVAERPGSGEAERRSTAQAMSDDEGEFLLDGLDAGHYMVTATRSGYAPARVEMVEAGAEDLELQLSNGASLTGQVTDGETGEPLAGFSVLVLLRVSELGRETYQTTTVFDPDGRYEIVGLAPGDYDVIATARDFAPSQERRISIDDPAPDEPQEADFQLGRGGRITGRVIDSASRQPLEHARVSVEAALGSASASAVQLLASTTTDASGNFELRGLSSGLRSVFVAAFDHHRRLISGLTVNEGGDIGPLTIDLRPVAEGEEPTLELTGIGAILSIQGDVLLVGQIIEGGGAAEVGLTPGDGILAVDGVNVVDLGFGGSIERIRGPENTTVRLTVRRAGTEEIDIIVVPRRRISA